MCVRIRSMWQRLIKLLKLWFSCSVGFQSDFSSFSGVQHLQISDGSLHISTTVIVMQHFFVLDTFQWPVFSFLSISYSGASNKWSLLQMLTWRKFQTTIYFTPSDEILNTFFCSSSFISNEVLSSFMVLFHHFFCSYLLHDFGVLVHFL